MPKIYDLRSSEYMYRPEGAGRFGVAGDRRSFEPGYDVTKDNRAQGLDAVSIPDMNGSRVEFRLKQALMNQPQSGDYLIIETDRRDGPTVIAIETIEDDPTTTLPYFEAHGHEVQGAITGLNLPPRPAD